MGLAATAHAKESIVRAGAAMRGWGLTRLAQLLDVDAAIFGRVEVKALRYLREEHLHLP